MLPSVARVYFEVSLFISSKRINFFYYTRIKQALHRTRCDRLPFLPSDAGYIFAGSLTPFRPFGNMQRASCGHSLHGREIIAPAFHCIRGLYFRNVCYPFTTVYKSVSITFSHISIMLWLSLCLKSKQ